MSDSNDKLDPEDLDAALEGPMSENAYPDDRTVNIDGREVPMNDLARRYNKHHGLTDNAADVPHGSSKA